jgi:hypothetical protein
MSIKLEALRRSLLDPFLFAGCTQQRHQLPRLVA